jgi:hypothetical protein
LQDHGVTGRKGAGGNDLQPNALRQFCWDRPRRANGKLGMGRGYRGSIREGSQFGWRDWMIYGFLVVGIIAAATAVGYLL